MSLHPFPKNSKTPIFAFCQSHPVPLPLLLEMMPPQQFGKFPGDILSSVSRKPTKKSKSYRRRFDLGLHSQSRLVMMSFWISWLSVFKASLPSTSPGHDSLAGRKSYGRGDGLWSFLSFNWTNPYSFRSVPSYIIFPAIWF